MISSRCVFYFHFLKRVENLWRRCSSADSHWATQCIIPGNCSELPMNCESWSSHITRFDQGLIVSPRGTGKTLDAAQSDGVRETIGDRSVAFDIASFRGIPLSARSITSTQMFPWRKSVGGMADLEIANGLTDTASSLVAPSLSNLEFPFSRKPLLFPSFSNAAVLRIL